MTNYQIMLNFLLDWESKYKHVSECTWLHFFNDDKIDKNCNDSISDNNNNDDDEKDIIDNNYRSMSSSSIPQVPLGKCFAWKFTKISLIYFIQESLLHIFNFPTFLDYLKKTANAQQRFTSSTIFLTSFQLRFSKSLALIKLLLKSSISVLHTTQRCDDFWRNASFNDCQAHQLHTTTCSQGKVWMHASASKHTAQRFSTQQLALSFV